MGSLQSWISRIDASEQGIILTASLVSSGWQNPRYYKPVVYASDSPNFSQNQGDYMYGPFADPNGWMYLSSNGRVDCSVQIGSGIFQNQTTYYFKCCWAYSYSGNDSDSNWEQASGTGQIYSTAIEEFYIDITPSLLQWSWETEAGSWNYEYAYDHLTLIIDAYGAVARGGGTTNFSHLIWNDLVYWLIQLQSDLNLNSAGYDSSVLMSSNDKVLTYSRWNLLADIWDRVAGGLNSNQTLRRATQYQPVLGSYFLTNLVGNMNTLISNYNNS